MRTFTLVVSLISLLIVLACGGGGGGGNPITTITVFGRVLNVSNGAGSAGVTIQVGAATAVTATDGSFSITTLSTGGTLIVNTTPTRSFTVPVSSSNVDLGDLYVGPSSVTLNGKVLDSASAAPVPGATVRFAGRSGVTDTAGLFSIPNVAYDPASTAGFVSIVGTLVKSGYFDGTFTAANATISGSTVTVVDSNLVPQGSSNPPSYPYTLYGKVNPVGTSTGAIVDVFSGTTKIRSFSVGSDGNYYIWVPAGNYTVKFSKESLTAPDASVTVPTDGIIKQDATLN